MNNKKRTLHTQFKTAKKVFSVLCLSFLALLYLLFGIGAAGIGIWGQAIPVFLASLSLAVGIFRIVQNRPASFVVFWGTLPAWLIHIPITIIIEDESPIFVIATSLIPIVAGVLLLLQRRK